MVKCYDAILWVKSVFGDFTHKVAQSWFVFHATQHTTLFGIYYCVEVVRIENHSHVLEIKCYDAILWVKSVFGTFTHKVAQTWFVFHATQHTTLFGIYYCVDVVRI